MNVAVLNTQIPFCYGGAEVLADDLVQALSQYGHTPTLVTVPFKWYPQQSLINSILSCKLLDLEEYNGIFVERAIALKFPMWLCRHDNLSLWILHQHRAAYDLWDTEYNDLGSMPDGYRLRDMITREDTAAIGRRDRVFTISNNVTNRLKRYNGIDSRTLYPPPRDMERYRFNEFGDFFFFPSRVTPLKRQALVIEALAFTSSPLKVVFAGQADDHSYLEELQRRAATLGVDEKIEWAGFISDEEKRSYYADALMVLFPPFNEDYGYIAPEAMLSGKGVITLTDSGGPLEFVSHENTGLVLDADPRAFGEQLDRIWQDRSLAKRMGRNARESVDAMDISWQKVIEALVPA